MFTKKLFQKATQQLLQQRDRAHHHQPEDDDLRQELREEESRSSLDPQVDVPPEGMDFRPRFTVHYGIPNTARILAFDPTQSLLAVGTLDGRIKVIGGNNIEALLVSPKQMSMKHLEFLKNQGFLVSVSNGNDIQVWDLKNRCIACSLEWESNITAFSVIQGTKNMYIGDENGMVYVLKFDTNERQLIQLPYLIPADSIGEAAQIPVPYHQSVVGVLTQPCSKGNRMLIAYEQGLLVLWDISRNQVNLVRGCKDLQLKSQTVMNIPSSGSDKSFREISDDEQLEKEISSLCWASSDGSVLAVGYIDGDIILWNMETSVATRSHHSKDISDNVIKLQLSSGSRRLPVIVLHWSMSRSQNGYGGCLFVYGGDEIGSEEVLTILSLQWARGLENVKCLGRMDLTLTGSFADMALLPTADEVETEISHGERKATVSPSAYTMVIPNVEPLITVAKLGVVDSDRTLSSVLSKIVAEANQPTESFSGGGSKWPLTGGVPSHNILTEAYQVEKLYIAGYNNGSVRVWDATTPTFTPICALLQEVEGISLAHTPASISSIDFCPATLSLAVGDESGLIRIYQMTSPNESTVHIITDKVNKVKSTVQLDGPSCVAVVSLLESPICNVQFAKDGSRLAIGYACGQVAILDTSVPSVLSVTHCSSDTSSPIVSVAFIFTSDEIRLGERGASESDCVGSSTKSITLVLTKNSCITVIDSADGGVMGSQLFNSEKGSNAVSLHVIDDINETTSTDTPSKALVILCCEDSISLFPLTCAIQMDQNFVQTVNLPNPCCWTGTLKRGESDNGIILFYQTGDIEMRSLPNLQVVGKTSLMSILRWNFKANMEKTVSSSENGQITLVNGCEFAVLSLLDKENDLRIPLSLPVLHDEVLAAASSSRINISVDQKKQNVGHGIFGGVFKGLIPGEEDDDIHALEEDIVDPAHIGAIFSQPLMFESTSSFAPDHVIELNIDDIEIDEPVAPAPSSSSQQTKPMPVKRDERSDRERLFEGANADMQPRMRTREEIIAKYRKTGAKDASAAALQAKNKLMERGEKLERISLRTQELQDGAENFASLASELAKTMENHLCDGGSAGGGLLAPVTVARWDGGSAGGGLLAPVTVARRDGGSAGGGVFASVTVARRDGGSAGGGLFASVTVARRDGGSAGGGLFASVTVARRDGGSAGGGLFASVTVARRDGGSAGGGLINRATVAHSAVGRMMTK
ncbi:hypothetical protein MLD38_011103 [Melastoma candidum]|uniref:Uncharacterized protein n=1 Tax=Melastoma candidum TaxID=119954 RepID=A0ACB9R346_9MYRT|nr:hypothetical protein MLD38_011103 [Melastoma candidum]